MDRTTATILLAFSTLVAAASLLGVRRRRRPRIGDVPWFPWHGVLIVALILIYLSLIQIASV